MTADSLVNLLAAAALLFATLAHYDAICDLPDFALTAVLLAVATSVRALVPGPVAHTTAGVLLLCAQLAAAVAVWRIYRSAPEEPVHEPA